MIEFARYNGSIFGAGTERFIAYVSRDGISTRTRNGGLDVDADEFSLKFLGFDEDESPNHPEIIDSWVQWMNESSVDDSMEIYFIE